MITAQQLAAALRAAANALDGTYVGNEAQTQLAAPQTQYVAPQVQQPQTQFVAPQTQFVAPQNVPQNITGDDITALIQPHVGNDAIKAALGNAMRSMGIANLPDTQPHQYPALYAAFQQIIAQATGGGAGPAPAATSII